MRRYDEPVQVRLTTDASGLEPARPDAFLWRRRLYVVRQVLSTWLEREAWWETPATAGRRPDYERTVWRVEAGAGRWVGTGVYDLTETAPVPAMAGTRDADPASAGGRAGAQESTWRLLCHLD